MHKELGGPGFLEAIYEEVLFFELTTKGFNVERQKLLPVIYKGVELNKTLCLELLVEDQLIIEVKAVEKFNPVFASQLLTYLRLGHYRLGVLLNFGVPYLKDGIHRVVNNCPEI